MDNTKRGILAIILSVITIAVSVVPAIILKNDNCLWAFPFGVMGIITIIFAKELCTLHNSYHNALHVDGDSDTTPSDFFLWMARITGMLLYLCQLVPLIVILCDMYQ